MSFLSETQSRENEVVAQARSLFRQDAPGSGLHPDGRNLLGVRRE